VKKDLIGQIELLVPASGQGVARHPRSYPGAGRRVAAASRPARRAGGRPWRFTGPRDAKVTADWRPLANAIHNLVEASPRRLPSKRLPPMSRRSLQTRPVAGARRHYSKRRCGSRHGPVRGSIARVPDDSVIAGW
jgi:hypothetical protein